MKIWLTGILRAYRNIWQALGWPGDGPASWGRRTQGGRVESALPSAARKHHAEWAEDLAWGVLWWLCLVAIALAAGSASRFIYVDF